MTVQNIYSPQIAEKGQSKIGIFNQQLSSGGYVYRLVVTRTIVDNKKMIVGK